MMLDKENNRAAMMLAAGLAALLAMGIAFFVISDTGTVPLIVPVILLAIILLGVGAAFWYRASRQGDIREWSGNPYELIDQLVEDITADEARFLWRKINTADHRELSESIQALIASRSEEHEAERP